MIGFLKLVAAVFLGSFLKDAVTRWLEWRSSLEWRRIYFRAAGEALRHYARGRPSGFVRGVRVDVEGHRD